MDISTVLVFVLGLLITPLIVGAWVLWTERNSRRFKKAQAFVNKAGYEVISKTDPRIQPWGSKADARVPAETPWFYKTDSGYTR